MTPSTGTDEHPEVAEISALAEGILPPDRSADVLGHLDECVLCADVRASLDEIRDLLGTLPGPPRMPADIAGRIDAALAAEALLDSMPPGSNRPVVSRETATETTPPPVLVSRETSTPVDRPAGHPPRATGPGRARPRRLRRKGLLIAAPVATVLVLGGVLISSLSPSRDTSNGSAAQPTAASTGVKAVGDDLKASVYSLLAGTTMSPMLSPDTGATGTAGTTVPVPPCVLQATNRTDAPLATRHDTYQGKDSYLVVLSHPGDDSQVDAFVVDASCTSSPGKVLRHATYPRQP